MRENAEREVTDGILRHLAQASDSDVIRELAGQVLAGNISLAEGLSFGSYAEALEPELEGFTQWYDTLSNDERDKEASDFGAKLDELEAQLDDRPAS